MCLLLVQSSVPRSSPFGAHGCCFVAPTSCMRTDTRADERTGDTGCLCARVDGEEGCARLKSVLCDEAVLVKPVNASSRHGFFRIWFIEIYPFPLNVYEHNWKCTLDRCGRERRLSRSQRGQGTPLEWKFTNITNALAGCVAARSLTTTSLALTLS